MQPYEVLIPILFLVFTFLILMKLIKNRHERKKWESMKTLEDGSKSLTTSELQLMIEEAVERATEARFAELHRVGLLSGGESHGSSDPELPNNSIDRA